MGAKRLPFGKELADIAGRMHDVRLIESGGQVVDVLEPEIVPELVREQFRARAEAIATKPRPTPQALPRDVEPSTRPRR